MQQIIILKTLLYARMQKKITLSVQITTNFEYIKQQTFFSII